MMLTINHNVFSIINTSEHNSKDGSHVLCIHYCCQGHEQCSIARNLVDCNFHRKTNFAMNKNLCNETFEVRHFDVDDL